jgi:hypothetical protein
MYSGISVFFFEILQNNNGLKKKIKVETNLKKIYSKLMRFYADK